MIEPGLCALSTNTLAPTTLNCVSPWHGHVRLLRSAGLTGVGLIRDVVSHRGAATQLIGHLGQRARGVCHPAHPYRGRESGQHRKQDR